MSSGRTPTEEQGVWKPGQDTVWDDGGPKMMEGHVHRGKAAPSPESYPPQMPNQMWTNPRHFPISSLKGALVPSASPGATMWERPLTGELP